MPESKLMTEGEAIERFVADGDSVYVGYTAAAYGLCQAIVRAGKRNLEAIGGSVGPQGTFLFLGGCANRVRSGYVASALRPGLVQDMMNDGSLKYEDYSNQGIALMLMAGALGVPFIPTRSFLGSDYLREEYQEHPGGFLDPGQKWAQMESPFDGQKFVALPALRPDVAVLHAQRADEQGNVQTWGHIGDARWAYWAAKKVIVSVEEIVPHEVIANDPGRTVVPGFRVAAVVHMPFGAHPSGCTGYYDFDYAFQAATMSRINRTREDWDAYAAEWIHGVADRAAYVRRIQELFGKDALEQLRVDRGPSPEPSVRYGHTAELRFRMPEGA
ncbi:MAG: CoA transferase subunit A [Dehalococcoidia bacterium]|nr:CoA transferase subunit A [Dehalococcoidia bacterium]